MKCDCGKCYLGQTGRTIKCRIKEHERHTISGQNNLSAIAEHAYNNPGHNIVFNEVKVLAITEKYLPRIIKEVVEIQKHNNNFNRDDSFKLSPTWIRLFKDTKNFYP